MKTIDRGMRVRLHLEICLEDGTGAMSTFGEEPIEITVGDGTLAPELEHLLLGLAADADETFLANGSDLYGPRIDEKVHWLPSKQFPTHLEVVPGQVVAFDTPGGQETAGMVLALGGDRVQVDFNHPLAGRTLQIRARILSVTGGQGPTRSG